MLDEAAVMMLSHTKSPIFVPSHTSTHSSSSTHSTSHHHAPTPPPTSLPAYLYEDGGSVGGRTLWVIFFGMLFSSVIFGFMAYRVPVQKRLFHVLTAFITVFATLSYYAMAVGYNSNGHGWSYSRTTLQQNEFGEPTQVLLRKVFWARYVDWTVTTPLLLLDLALLAGMNGANITVTIVADVIMILTGFFAAFGATEGEKWGWYAMGCLAFLVVIWQLAVPGRKAVMAKDAKTSKLFGSIAVYTLILWTLYPVVWGIGEGARKMPVDTEIVIYAILDVLAKPVFGFWLLSAHSGNANTSIEGFWSNGLSSEGAIRIDDDEGA